MTTKRIALASLCLMLTACNTSGKFTAGNMQYETAHMPSVWGSTTTGILPCGIAERDEKGDCPAGHPMILSQPGLFASMFGPMVQAAGIAGAGIAIGDGLSKSGSRYNSSSNVSVDQGVNIRGHYGSW